MNFNSVTDAEIVRFENLRTQNLLYGQDFLVCPLCTIKARFKGHDSNTIVNIKKGEYRLNDTLKCECGGEFVMTWSKSWIVAKLPVKKYKDELHGSVLAVFKFKNPKQRNEKSPKNSSGDANNSLFS